MTDQQKKLIMEAWDYCDLNDKSDAFMFAYMADFSRLSYDEVIDYIHSEGSESDRKIYFAEKYGT